MNRPKTIFCDIDGTLLEHREPSKIASGEKAHILPNTIQVLKQWDRSGNNIILVTGRKESMRKATELELSQLGVIYDKLLMGIGGGDRILINDRKPDGRLASWSINPNRNNGLEKYSFSNLTVKAKKYFQYFSEKNIKELSDMFSENVELKDWDVELKGKKKVISGNKNIFNAVSKLNVEVHSISQVDSRVYAEITVFADSEAIPVIDIIDFDKESKIKSITAYKRI